MNWDGVKGVLGSVIDTALPIFLGLLDDDDKSDEWADIGVLTMYRQSSDGELMLGNLRPYPALINFAPAQGELPENRGNLAVELQEGGAFPATEWLQAYADGNVAIGTTRTDSNGPAGITDAFFTFASSLVLTVADTIRAVVNPKLEVTFKLDASNNFVLVAALGSIAYLGRTYMLTATNNAGKVGSVSGTLQPVSDSTGSDDEAQFTMPLPVGVDYSNGIYDFDVQLAIQLSGNSVATDPAVEITLSLIHI